MPLQFILKRILSLPIPGDSSSPLLASTDSTQRDVFNEWLIGGLPFHIFIANIGALASLVFLKETGTKP